MIKPHPEWAWEALKGLSGASGEKKTFDRNVRDRSTPWGDANMTAKESGRERDFYRLDISGIFSRPDLWHHLEVRQSLARDTDIVFGLSATECRDPVTSFGASDDSSIPAKLARHGRSDSATTVFECVCHLSGFCVSNGKKIRTLAGGRWEVFIPSHDDHLRTPGLDRVPLKIGHQSNAPYPHRLRLSSHGCERYIGGSVKGVRGGDARRLVMVRFRKRGYG